MNRCLAFLMGGTALALQCRPRGIRRTVARAAIDRSRHVETDTRVDHAATACGVAVGCQSCVFGKDPAEDLRAGAGRLRDASRNAGRRGSYAASAGAGLGNYLWNPGEHTRSCAVFVRTRREGWLSVSRRHRHLRQDCGSATRGCQSCRDRSIRTRAGAQTVGTFWRGASQGAAEIRSRSRRSRLTKKHAARPCPTQSRRVQPETDA